MHQQESIHNSRFLSFFLLLAKEHESLSLLIDPHVISCGTVPPGFLQASQSPSTPAAQVIFFASWPDFQQSTWVVHPAKVLLLPRPLVCSSNPGMSFCSVVGYHYREVIPSHLHAFTPCPYQVPSFLIPTPQHLLHCNSYSSNIELHDQKWHAISYLVLLAMIFPLPLRFSPSGFQPGSISTNWQSLESF